MCAIQPATGTISWLCVPSDVDFCQPFLSTFSVPPFVFSLCISSSLSFAIVLISQKQIRVSWWCGSWKICLIAIRLALNFNRVMPLSYAHILCVQSNPIFRFISILFRFSFSFLCVFAFPCATLFECHWWWILGTFTRYYFHSSQSAICNRFAHSFLHLPSEKNLVYHTHKRTHDEHSSWIMNSCFVHTKVFYLCDLREPDRDGKWTDGSGTELSLATRRPGIGKNANYR